MKRIDYNELGKDDLIMMLRELNGEVEIEEDRKIRYPQDAVAWAHTIRNRKQEHFIVLNLDGAHGVINRSNVSKGIVNKSIVHPREVFRGAIQKNATAIILMHNHPSGNVAPSQEDKDITERLKEAGTIIGIQVLDHVIVSKNRYYSFLEHNLL